MQPQTARLRQHQFSHARRRMRQTIPCCRTCYLLQRVSAKIEEGVVRGAAMRLAASNDTLAAYDDDDTAAALRQLHPSRAAPTCESQLQPVVRVPVLMLSENDITSAIKSFLAGSAGGLDGLRPQHRKDMTSPITGIAGQRLMIASLMEFCNVCLAGVVPFAIRPILYDVLSVR
jgi:hypothetical protein